MLLQLNIFTIYHTVTNFEVFSILSFSWKLFIRIHVKCSLVTLFNNSCILFYSIVHVLFNDKHISSNVVKNILPYIKNRVTIINEFLWAAKYGKVRHRTSYLTLSSFRMNLNRTYFSRRYVMKCIHRNAH